MDSVDFVTLMAYNGWLYPIDVGNSAGVNKMYNPIPKPEIFEAMKQAFEKGAANLPSAARLAYKIEFLSAKGYLRQLFEKHESKELTLEQLEAKLDRFFKLRPKECQGFVTAVSAVYDVLAERGITRVKSEPTGEERTISRMLYHFFLAEEDVIQIKGRNNVRATQKWGNVEFNIMQSKIAMNKSEREIMNDAAPLLEDHSWVYNDTIEKGVTALPQEHRDKMLHASGKDGYTLLHHAAREGDVESVMLLIKAGANIHAKSTQSQNTPLTLAVEHLRVGVVAALLRVNIKDRGIALAHIRSDGKNAGRIILLQATNHASPGRQIFDILTEAENSLTNTPLMEAIRARDQNEIDRLLALKETDINAVRTSDNKSPLSLALDMRAYPGVLDIIRKLLLDPRLDLKKQAACKEWHEVVTNAIEKNSSDVIKKLIEHYPVFVSNVKVNSYGPWALAVVYNATDVLKLLFTLPDSFEKRADWDAAMGRAIQDRNIEHILLFMEQPEFYFSITYTPERFEVYATRQGWDQVVAAARARRVPVPAQKELSSEEKLKQENEALKAELVKMKIKLYKTEKKLRNAEPTLRVKTPVLLSRWKTMRDLSHESKLSSVLGNK